MTDKADALIAQLHALASPQRAAISQNFFKTGPGQYGEGDVFIGITMPDLRALTKKHRDVDLSTIRALLASGYHEVRMFALLLLIQFYQAADEAGQQAAFELYIGNTGYINNWDLVDVSAPHIVGCHLWKRPRGILMQLARSDSLWERRIAILSTFYFIRKNDFDDTLRIAEVLLDDEHDLMHKAIGWMLREVGKRDQALEEHFLQQHYPRLARTALRYAIERFAPVLREKYLKGHFSIA
ncbi:MAG: DNA alkylation repair protein [Sideroxydans sp.]|nr:DNA alkylation repair protein [Sideroxydans sp.]